MESPTYIHHFLADSGDGLYKCRSIMLVHDRRFISAVISAFQIGSLFGQQTCYWPDGTVPLQSEGYVNCFLNQDSHCCLSSEACLSNGLCYGSRHGWVGGQLAREETALSALS